MPPRRILAVGDVHATPDELDDCYALMVLVARIARLYQARVLFLGDQYNTHAVIRAEVLWFWRENFRVFREFGLKIIALIGNHDFAGEGLRQHVMVAHEDQVSVVDKPQVFPEFPGVLFMPYQADREHFVTLANQVPDTKTLICHQTFHGSQYENGFYAEDGVEPDRVPQDLILSGHIHCPQSFGKVTYLGAPRWRTLSDADVDRAIWLLEFDDAGRLVSKEGFDTGEVCRQIKYRLDTPENPVALPLDPRHDWRVDVKGPASWLERRKVELAAPGTKLRVFTTDRVAPKVRESEGVEKAFHSYLEAYRPKFGTDPVRLGEMARERLHV